MGERILEIKDLRIHYTADGETVEAVNGVNLELDRGETLGLVGETGAGKTTLAKGIMGIIPNPPGKVVGGSVLFEGDDLIGKSNSKMYEIRGKKISMIFQDPMTALNPVITIGDQISEVIRIHERLSRADASRKARKMLETVGIQGIRYAEYPHQFSGGMKQRVVIAMALACNPALLIADEPTTALDVTIQAQVLDLMNNLKKELRTSMILITHDFGVVAETCDKVAIMYAGEIIEKGNAEDIFERGCHPYTKGLFASLPDLGTEKGRLQPIAGLMPDPKDLPKGCKFAPRCPSRTEACDGYAKEIVGLSDSHQVRCLLFEGRGREIRE